MEIIENQSQTLTKEEAVELAKYGLNMQTQSEAELEVQAQIEEGE